MGSLTDLLQINAQFSNFHIGHAAQFSSPCSSQRLSQTKVNKKNETKQKRTRRKPRSKKESEGVSSTNEDSPARQVKDKSLKKQRAQKSTSESSPTERVKDKKRTVKNESSSGKEIVVKKPKVLTPKRKWQSKNVKFDCKIEIVKKEMLGFCIRKRNLNYKHVNLNSFVSVAEGKPVIFTTTLQNKLQVIKNKNEVPKSQKRKYTFKQLRWHKPKAENTTKPFENYKSLDEVNQGLANGTLLKGFVRINPKHFTDAYVNNEDSSLADYYMSTVWDRNRALDGDEVVLELKPESEWINGYKTAKVVFILQQNHPRIVVGTLKPSEKRNANYAVLYPRDKRCPYVRVLHANCPQEFIENPQQFEKFLFVGKILEWTVPGFAQGIVTENLGERGSLEVESLSILREFCLDTTPFDSITTYVSKFEDMSAEEIGKREDLRKECIFTIDPATARDLDDAVSAKLLSNGNYEIGVHISDASFYLEENTYLDQLVKKKATTIYLVDKVYHMLPEELCLYCSLLPGQDKLSFSVIWEITPDAKIVSTRFTRSIINSCCKLHYEHAQQVIDDPNKHFENDDFPEIYNNFNCNDVIEVIKILQSIAVQLREKRVQDGALKIDQIKLNFNLDPLTGEPLEFSIYDNKASHRLIEEFMLLANISVAEKIKDSYPELAFLRCHEPPKHTLLEDLKHTLASYGIHIDITSSGGINKSLKKYITDDFAGQCRGVVLNHLTAKCMTRARYFCASVVESEDDFKHYALSMPIYTHFTSPIRRYADIMVHRLLAASLNYCEVPQWNIDDIVSIAANCNKQKYNAKRAGDASMELYLGHYIEKHSPFIQNCVVVDVKERSFDVIVLKTGSLIRIYKNNLDKEVQWETEIMPSQENAKTDKKQIKVTIKYPKTKNFPETSIVVEIFSIVQVHLERKNNSYKLDGNLVRPVLSTVFTRQSSDS